MKNYLKSTVIILSLNLFNLSYASDELRLNDGLPVMIDRKTELNDILLKDMNITYTYQLKNISIEDAKNLKEDNQYFIEKNACNDENIQCLFKKDLDVTFVYKIKQQEILKVDLNKSLCDKLSQHNYVL